MFGANVLPPRMCSLPPSSACHVQVLQVQGESKRQVAALTQHLQGQVEGETEEEEEEEEEEEGLCRRVCR